jgi:hypothetical protein
MGSLAPDRQVLAQFKDLMFKHARGDAFISLRSFPDKGSKSERAIHTEAIRINDREFLNIAVIRATQAANWHEPAVFCPPVATFQDASSAKTDNLCEGPCLSVDCDQYPHNARATLENLLGPATAIVESGGEWTNPETGEAEPKVHLHWRLKETARTSQEHASLYEARTLATRLVGADATAVSLVHPLRWPGSVHRKGEPRLARIIFAGENEIDLTPALDVLREAAGAQLFAGTDKPSPEKLKPSPEKLRARDPRDFAAALEGIPNKDLSWRDWNRIGLATFAASGGSDEGKAAFAAFSAKSAKNDPATTLARWEHYRTSPPDRIGMGTLAYLACQHNPLWTLPSLTTPDAETVPVVDPVEPVDLWGKFDPPTLPRGVLPQVIEEFAFDRGMTIGCDMSGIAVGALAVCAGAIPDSIKLQPKRNDTEWQEAARIWVLVIGDPSTMKTPSILAATKPLRRIDNEMAREYQDALDAWARLSKDEQKNVPKPKRLRAMIFDTTIEATQEILRDSPAGVLLEDDELSGWFDAMYKYTGPRGAQKDRSFWLQAYNGGPKNVDRVGRGSVHIPNLSVSIIGGSQPGPIRKLADSGEDDGLLQRFLPIMLRPAIGGRDEPPGQAVSDYDRLIRNLRELEPPVGGVLVFDDGALKIRAELEKKHLDLMQLEGLNRKLTSHFGKYNGIFARLCVIFHCVEHAGGQLPARITEATARRVAGLLHGFLLKHAVAFYVDVLGLSNDHDRLANVADYILAHKLERITNRDVARGDRSMRGLARRETEAIFEQLEALGWVTRTPGPRASDPPHWIVNPVVHQRFAERAKDAAKRRKQDGEMIDDLLKRQRQA